MEISNRADIEMLFDQDEFDIRCEWGSAGIAQLVQNSDVIIIVDVLPFSTSVNIAVSNGAIVYPYPFKDDSAISYAKSRNAILASFERKLTTGYSLAPTSLVNIPAGTRLVLPSPNGSTLSLETGDVPTFAGCLQNARAVAQAVQQVDRRISIIPAGERWQDSTLRLAIEDLIGAGAIIHHLVGTRSPEASVAENAFTHVEPDLVLFLKACSSGKELMSRGFERDVELAAALNHSDCVPMLKDRTYIPANKVY
jgi:2-phosphosulfolactate phosphatase